MKNKLHVRIDPTDLEFLKKIAKETRRTMSSLFYEALEMVIKKYAKRYLQKNKRNEIRETYAWKKIVQRNKG